MLFNSLNFALFLPIVFILYWFVFYRKLNYQNALILVASYFFYACWDWRFLFLLVFSTLLDYFSAIKISKTKNSKIRKIWFSISIGINLSFLLFFKYFNFFVDSFVLFFNQIGIYLDPFVVSLVLPVGISFYTFHGLSYVIDVYKNKIKIEKNIINYAVFVSFFPLLVAGPIERATHLLPQFKIKRSFSYAQATDGCRLILWGLFKKVAIADYCGIYVNEIYESPEIFYGGTLFIATFLFSIQIYSDFSGYSDIARGISKLFGIELIKNFNLPYFSKSIADFWKKWHISLTSWFRDYVYIPLGGSFGNKLKTIRNVFVVFLISGFWHGSNWTFVTWGFVHAILFITSLLITKISFPKFIIFELVKVIFTFLIVLLAWIFFRAENLFDVKIIFSSIFSSNLFQLNSDLDLVLFELIFVLFVIEYFGRKFENPLSLILSKKHPIINSLTYILLVFIILYFSFSTNSFIYFQF